MEPRKNKMTKEMKRIYIILLFAAGVLCSMTSCKKDKQDSIAHLLIVPENFYGNGNNDQKLYFDDETANQMYVCWANGDAIYVNDETYNFSVYGGKAALTADIPSSDLPFKVIFPASILDVEHSYPEGNEYQATIHLPKRQIYRDTRVYNSQSGTYTLRQNIQAPMAGILTQEQYNANDPDEQRTIVTRNLCNMVCVPVKAPRGGMLVDSIEMWATANSVDVPLYGTYTLSCNVNATGWGTDGPLTGVNNTDSTHVVLVCPKGGKQLKSNESFNFYIYIPKVTGVQFQFNIYAHRTSTDGSDAADRVMLNKSQQSNAISLSRSQVAEFPKLEGCFEDLVTGGTVDAPWEITTLAELQQMATDINSGTGYFLANQYFVLAPADDAAFIDASSVTLTPIGTAEHPFTGHFDGNGKTIKIGAIADVTNAGIFGVADTASITGLKAEGTLTMTAISNITNYGTICGYAIGCTIADCQSSVNVSMTTAATGTKCWGGICGLAKMKDDGSSVIRGSLIRHCKNTGSITIIHSSSGTRDFIVGGICGGENHKKGNNKYCAISDIVIDSCLNGGTLTAQVLDNPWGYGLYMGGIIGENHGTVRNCGNTGNIYPSTNKAPAFIFIGGIAGTTGVTIPGGVGSEIPLVENCYNQGNIDIDKTGIGNTNYSDRYSGGGILGNNARWPKNNPFDGLAHAITNCCCSGDITNASGQTYTGAACGYQARNTTCFHWLSGTGKYTSIDGNGTEASTLTDCSSYTSSDVATTVSALNSWVSTNQSGKKYASWNTANGQPALNITW